MKHSEKWRFPELDDEDRLFLARCVALLRLAGASHLIPGTNEPRPRLVEWSDHPDGWLIAIDKARYIIHEEDVAGLTRLGSMVRTEFAGGVVGCC
jgi:hypothetical protein